MRENLHFIKEHGAEHFLAALDEPATAAAGTGFKLLDAASSVHPAHVMRASSFSRTNSNMNSRPNSANGASVLPGKLVSFTEPSINMGCCIHNNAEGNAVTPLQKQLGTCVYAL